MIGLLVALAAIAVATVFGFVWRSRDGVLRPQSRDPQGGDVETLSAQHAATKRLSAGDLGAPLGERATLVQFSTAFCAPCRATRRTLDEVARMVDGVQHVEIDAESRLDLVRRLNIIRTPTVLVLDASGHIVQRASGQPRKADVIAVLGTAIPS
jgi:thiol-disulfide isomerase/thioredoxin